MHAARGAFVSLYEPIANGRFRFDPQRGALVGWVVPEEGPSAPLAILHGETVLNIIHAADAVEEDAPAEAFGFTWPVPDLVRTGNAGLALRVVDLTGGGALDGPDMLDPLTETSHGSGKGWGGEPSYWPNGIAGGLTSWFNHVADGVWADVDPTAVGPRFERADPPPASSGFSWGARLTAENEVSWTVHQRLPDLAAEVGEEERFKLWLKLSKATSNTTQCHVEIFLSRWNGQAFDRLRRLRRSRVMRRFSSTEVQMVLEPEERELAASGELVLTIAFGPCFGLVMCPLVPSHAPESGSRFEDGRLTGAFAACEELTRIYDERLGREVLLAPEHKVSVPAVMRLRTEVPMTEIIVPVYNGADVVTRCLRSVRDATDTPFRVKVIDDGSRGYTTLLLDEIVAGDERFSMHRRALNRGYTKSINEAIKLTDAEWVVILNSDTVVSKGWLRRLHEAAARVPGAGLIGPLSNAATWQSVPQAKNPDGSWSQNDFIEPEIIEDVQAKLAAASECTYPCFPVLNGFCTLISRAVFDTVGYFDEEAFPLGYGEETDMCLRAGLAGFKLVVADNCFVYHEKSVSFGSATRSKLTRAGGFELRNKHPGVNIGALERGMQFNTAMVRLRAKMAELESELRT
jgi:GT2 family glycosyltransferase